MQAASIIYPARKMAYAMASPLNPSVTRSHCHGRLRAFLAEAPLHSASAKNRCVLRVERLRPPAGHTLFPDTAPASRLVRVWLYLRP